MELIGRVLWWSERDENGIIVDPNGNEFYFDRSVLNLKQRQTIKDEALVTFSYNSSIKDCLCACNVKMPVASKKKSYEKRFEKSAFVGM